MRITHSIIHPAITNKYGLSLDTEIMKPVMSGRLPAVLMLHGFTGYKEDKSFVDLSCRLVECGIVSVRFTASGFGGSEGVIDKDYRFSNHLHDAFRVYEFMRSLQYIDIKRIGVHGHSLGGKLAIIFCSMVDDVRVLSIASAPVSLRLTMYGSFVDEWKRYGFFEKVSGRDGKKVRVPYSFFVDEEQKKYDTLIAAGKLVDQRVLVSVGLNDTEVPPSETKRIYESLACQKELAEIEELGHKYADYPKKFPVVQTTITDFFRKSL